MKNIGKYIMPGIVSLVWQAFLTYYVLRNVIITGLSGRDIDANNLFSALLYGGYFIGGALFVWGFSRFQHLSKLKLALIYIGCTVFFALRMIAGYNTINPFLQVTESRP